MSTINSIHLASEGVYYSKLNIRKNIPILEAVDFIPVDIHIVANQLDFDNQLVEILKSLYNHLGHDLNSLNISIQNDALVLSSIPYANDMGTSMIKDLLQLEIENKFVDFNLANFIPNLYPNDSISLAQLLFKSTNDKLNDIFDLSDISVNIVESGLISTAKSVVFNYPDRIKDKVLLLGFRNNNIDACVIGDSIIYYYQEKNVKGIDISDYAEKIVSEICNEYGVKTILLYGKGLTKSILDEFTSVGLQKDIICERINPFKMMRSSLNESQKKTCIAKRHLFSEVIGVAIPDYFKKIKI